MGSAFGSAVSGSIFAQTLTDAFFRDLPVIYRNGVMAELLLEKPFVSVGFPIGTELRDAVITCFRTTQGFLTLTGLGLCVPLIFFGLCMKSQTSSDEKSLMHDEIVTAGDYEEGRGLLEE
jgi:SIT family siderophore-iron:H+ symporter-like MFS transporter